MPDMAGSTHRPAREARCVVWHERGTELKPELLAALARPGFSVVRCDDEFEAVARVCRFANLEKPTPTGPSAVVILLIVDPRRLAAATTVFESVTRYAPTAAIWMYETGSTPQLRTVRPQDVFAWRRPETPIRPVVGPTGGKAEEPKAAIQESAGQEPPVIEIAQAGMATPPPPVGTIPDAAELSPVQPPPRLLTDDELAMLLDVEPRDDDERKV
ncbi:MAG: hypothetical protein JSR77_09270 [Planctomycetes bacterium]|nr:hypothetical protein [Planctomycetota bacterium]